MNGGFPARFAGAFRRKPGKKPEPVAVRLQPRCRTGFVGNPCAVMDSGLYATGSSLFYKKKKKEEKKEKAEFQFFPGRLREPVAQPVAGPGCISFEGI